MRMPECVCFNRGPSGSARCDWVVHYIRGALHVWIGLAVAVPDFAVLLPSLAVPGICCCLHVTHQKAMNCHKQTTHQPAHEEQFGRTSPSAKELKFKCTCSWFCYFSAFLGSARPSWLWLCKEENQIGHHARPRRASATAPLRTGAAICKTGSGAERSSNLIRSSNLHDHCHAVQQACYFHAAIDLTASAGSSYRVKSWLQLLILPSSTLASLNQHGYCLEDVKNQCASTVCFCCFQCRFRSAFQSTLLLPHTTRTKHSICSHDKLQVL